MEMTLAEIVVKGFAALVLVIGLAGLIIYAITNIWEKEE